MTSRHVAFFAATALIVLLATSASAQLTVTLGSDNSTIYFSISSVTPRIPPIAQRLSLLTVSWARQF